MYILIAILLFGLLIFIHELGHYLTARIFNVAINEFSIGMGPKLISKTSKKTGIAYSLRALPIGGFVSMAGEDEESDNPNAFDKKPVWQRMIVTAAGSVFNILLGIIVMFIIVLNTKVLPGTQIADFDDKATSNNYGLQVGDIIAEIDGHDIHIAQEYSYFIGRYGYEPVDVTVIRDGERIVVPNVVFPTQTDEASGVTFGNFDFIVYRTEKNFASVMKQSFWQSFLTIRTVVDSLADLFTGKFGVNDLSGPVGVTAVISDAAKQDAAKLWYIFVLLAMNLGVMNLLPIPALDGGRMIVLLIELIIRRPINKNVEGYINFVAMMILFAFMAFITIKDIGAIIGNFMEK